MKLHVVHLHAVPLKIPENYHICSKFSFVCASVLLNIDVFTFA